MQKHEKSGVWGGYFDISVVCAEVGVAINVLLFSLHRAINAAVRVRLGWSVLE
jgi:hypothetical protein